jgi:hypothetical protein
MCTSFLFCFTPFLPQSIGIRFIYREEILIPIYQSALAPTGQANRHTYHLRVPTNQHNSASSYSLRAAADSHDLGIRRLILLLDWLYTSFILPTLGFRLPRFAFRPRPSPTHFIFVFYNLMVILSPFLSSALIDLIGRLTSSLRLPIATPGNRGSCADSSSSELCSDHPSSLSSSNFLSNCY